VVNNDKKTIQRELNRIFHYVSVIFEPSARFNYTIIIKKEDAIVESIKLGVDYCLLLTLGKFRKLHQCRFEQALIVSINLWTL
jgi:hypothetical protein